ncbi:prepilin-type N-terminal cleavage/methylation domain-containing protein [Bacillus shivajii]|uniref:type IV pilus modification PilV family protein n=1 Tax=Bacillus shivajii TaxID=1983719 RepID=UPI001CFB6256|nr:prepilin-type N-terminal cleavage/methylation domain-containing protein [Bacillus shivajii]UCZ52141.1 prepilin-type N-terminal cleavage/methylation domain-containing protein [Bacillus shivajii]
MKYLNSKGLTLIELLAAITILSIVLITFFGFLTQSMFFSTKTENKLTSVHVAERVLYEVKTNLTEGDLSAFSQPCSATPLTVVPGGYYGLVEDETGHFYYETNNNVYYPIVTLCQTEDEQALNVYRVQVKIYDHEADPPVLLGETFDYIQ